jgi:predicted DNA-binding transcriptional regulator AlpA
MKRSKQQTKRRSGRVAPVLPAGYDGPQLLSAGNVVAITGLSWPTIKRLRRAGRFPKFVELSTNRKGFDRSAVERWITERVAGAR